MSCHTISLSVGCKYTLKLHFLSFLTVSSSCSRTNSGNIHSWNIAYTRGGVIFLLRKFYWRAIQKPARKWSEIRLRTSVAKFVNCSRHRHPPQEKPIYARIKNELFVHHRSVEEVVNTYKKYFGLTTGDITDITTAMNICLCMQYVYQFKTDPGADKQDHRGSGV
jgi:hypothetical protein